MQKFDDLQEKYWRNVETDVPFGEKPNGAASLTDADVNDLVAFLKTLTDGFAVEQGAPPPAAGGSAPGGTANARK